MTDDTLPMFQELLTLLDAGKTDEVLRRLARMGAMDVSLFLTVVQKLRGPEAMLSLMDDWKSYHKKVSKTAASGNENEASEPDRDHKT